MTTRTTCVMTFMTSLGKKRNIIINEPKPTLHSSNISQASNMLMAVNAFDDSVGNLTELDKVEVISVTKKTLV